MNSWTGPADDGADLASPYARHSGTLRGMLRHHLVDRALAQHLSGQPQRVLDIGGGTGQQARLLAARGHHLTIVDPDQAMLDKARAAWAEYTAATGSSLGQVCFLHGTGEQAPRLAGTGWDVVLCHGVLMYLQDPVPLLRALAECVRPGGLVSVLAKQDTALAMRPGLQRNWSGVVDALRTPVEHGRLGVESRGVSREEVSGVLAEQGVHAVEWYGVRCFTDHLGDEPAGDDFAQILEAEWEAGRRDPYRRIARLFHLIARADPSGSRSCGKAPRR